MGAGQPPAPPGPPTVSTDTILTGEALAVMVWRYDRLLELGLTTDAADELAHGTVDWHTVEALVAHGCPAAVAADIAT